MDTFNTIDSAVAQPELLTENNWRDLVKLAVHAIPEDVRRPVRVVIHDNAETGSPDIEIEISIKCADGEYRPKTLDITRFANLDSLFEEYNIGPNYSPKSLVNPTLPFLMVEDNHGGDAEFAATFGHTTIEEFMQAVQWSLLSMMYNYDFIDITPDRRYCRHGGEVIIESLPLAPAVPVIEQIRRKVAIAESNVRKAYDQIEEEFPDGTRSENLEGFYDQLLDIGSDLEILSMQSESLTDDPLSPEQVIRRCEAVKRKSEELVALNGGQDVALM